MKATFSQFVCSQGDHVQIGGDHLTPITITVRELRKFDEKNAPTLVFPPVQDYEAELELEFQGTLYGGAQVKRQGITKRFCVPANSEAIHPEPYAVFNFHFTEKSFRLFAVRVYHINMIKNTATIHVCQAFGSRP